MNEIIKNNLYELNDGLSEKKQKHNKKNKKLKKKQKKQQDGIYEPSQQLDNLDHDEGQVSKLDKIRSLMRRN